MASRVKQIELKGAAAVVGAMVALYAYQKAWITDEARFKLSVKSRQIGFTFGTTLRHVRRRLDRGGLTLWASASERQSKEAISYAKLHLEATREAFDYEQLEFPDTDEKAEQITFHHNKARMIALPANPDTMRGFAGDVVLDEFGFHRDPRKIWKSALGIASRGHNIEVISTPNGQQGKYWDLCKAAGVPPLARPEVMQWVKGIWSVHWCDIFAAVEQGCPIDIDAMHEASDDEDTWLQEYCCSFLADAMNYIPMDLVIMAESEQASLSSDPGKKFAGDLFLGGDIGRRKDRSVFIICEKLGDVMWVRHVERMDRQSFAAQEAFLEIWIPKCRRICLDSTGLGMQLGERMVTKFGSKVEPVEFNIANKEKMATATKAEFEERRCRIPAAPWLRSSINAVKRFTSTTGHFRFDADKTDAGHADEFWALALSIAAGSGPGISTDHIASRTQQAHVLAGAY